MILETYSAVELCWIALAILMLGMSKGGFPVGSIALPVLILVWPGHAEPAKTVVAFMLPLLCTMDVVALAFYRRHILWKRITPLLPGTILGVAVGSVLFVSREAAMLTVPDRWLKLCIGVLGVIFVVYRAMKGWLLGRLDATTAPGGVKAGIFGFFAGLTSTLAHAAGPVIQMYLLPQKLDKLHFVGTTVAFFFILNLVKMVPFALLGRIETGNLVLAAYLLPVIPIGVGTGYLLVRLLKPKYYVGFIHVVLLFTSVLLIVKAIALPLPAVTTQPQTTVDEPQDRDIHGDNTR
jgi:uncharacterized membrane protein YfcA